jgi:N-methylhydantoinase A
VPPGEIEVSCVALMHYAGQSDAIEVPFERPADPARLGRDFLARHERLYGFATDEPWELDTLRITAAAPPPLALSSLAAAEAAPTGEPLGTATCWFDSAGPVDTRRLARTGLPTGDRVAGPVIVEDAWSTVVVPPGSTLWADPHGHLHIEIGDKP